MKIDKNIFPELILNAWILLKGQMLIKYYFMSPTFSVLLRRLIRLPSFISIFLLSPGRIMSSVFSSKNIKILDFIFLSNDSTWNFKALSVVNVRSETKWRKSIYSRHVVVRRVNVLGSSPDLFHYSAVVNTMFLIIHTSSEADKTEQNNIKQFVGGHKKDKYLCH